MQFTLGEVYSFKLNSGEEMIAKVTAAPLGVSYVTIEHPVSVAPGPQGMGLVPSLFTGNLDSEITLNTSSVAMHVLTDDSVKNKYIEATTGIKLPEKKLVLG